MRYSFIFYIKDTGTMRPLNALYSLHRICHWRVLERDMIAPQIISGHLPEMSRDLIADFLITFRSAISESHFMRSI